MMEAVFLTLVNMSIHASILVLVVILLRLLFRRAPKWINGILWAMVAIRLVCPFDIASSFSLLPHAEVFPEEILMSPTPQINSGAPILDHVVNPILENSFTPASGDSVNPLQVVTFIASIVWIVGMLLMLGYMAFSYLHVRRRIGEAVLMQNSIYTCDHIASPFILGVIRPKIFLPSDMSSEDLPYVLAHETAHLHRRDHWWKPLGFLLLTVYWFNPLLWAAYILLCRDIEYACDERVLADMGIAAKKPYSDALINCSMERKTISACPLAFGEVGVAGRIRSVLHYKKPAFWIIAAAILVCTLTAVCFLTNPKESDIAYTRYGKAIALTEAYRQPAVTVVAPEDLPEDILAEFYQTAIMEEGGGWLFSIARHAEDDLLTAATNHGNFVYIAYDDSYWYGIMHPTDVQADLTNEARKEEYKTLRAEWEAIAQLFLEVNPELTAADNQAAYARAAALQGFSAPIEVIGTVNARKSVVDFAISLVDGLIREYNDYGASQEAITGSRFTITKAEITKLELIPTGTAGLDESVNLYRMECRLKPSKRINELQKFILRSDMQIEDRWFKITQPYFAMLCTWSGETETWYPLGVIYDETIRERFGTKEMLDKYGDIYTAAAMEMAGSYKETDRALFDDPLIWYADAEASIFSTYPYYSSFSKIQ